MSRSIFLGFLKLFIVLAILFAAGIWLFNRISVNIPTAGNIISIENEKKIGDLAVEEMILSPGGSKKLDDSLLSSQVKEITSRLIANIDSSKYKYNFVVLDDKQINAFTVPGGNIFIFKGLLEYADSHEEVAAVLAHEIGHAEKRHVVSKLVKELGLQMVIAVISGGDPGTVITISKHLLSTMYDRDMEREADNFSFRLMERAGIDPKSLAVFFQKLDKKGSSLDNVSFLNTHPSNDERIKECLNYKTKPGFTPRPFSSAWVKNQTGSESSAY